MDSLIIKGEMIHREIAGEHILIPVGETAMRLSGMICVSESGAMIWEKLKGGCTEAELVDMLLEQYDTDRTVAENDVKEFLGRLRSLELV